MTILHDNGEARAQAVARIVAQARDCAVGKSPAYARIAAGIAQTLDADLSFSDRYRASLGVRRAVLTLKLRGGEEDEDDTERMFKLMRFAEFEFERDLNLLEAEANEWLSGG